MEEKKEQVNLELRYSLKKNLLKSVLIRVDYSGVTGAGVERWVDEYKDYMRTAFAEYNRGVNNNARLDLSNMEEVAKTLSIPVSEIKKETQHIYTMSKLFHNDNPKDIVTDNVRMTVTSYFMTFYILCNEYKNIDTYLRFLSDFFTKFSTISEYMKIRRIGIRKIGGKPFDSLKQAYCVFKPEYFFGNNVANSFNVIQREYKDSYIMPDETLKVNYTRIYREQKTDSGVKHAFILDIDCYVDEYTIKKNRYELPRKIGDVMTIINNHLFEVFYFSVQKAYIENHGDQQ